jgi:hypothetical protein
VTSDEGNGVRGRDPAGELGLLLRLPAKAFVNELVRFRVLRADCGSIPYGVAKLESEF